MKPLGRYIRSAILLTGLFSFALSLSAQSALHWLSNGTWHPVYEVRGKIPYCFTGDRLVRGDSEGLTMLAAPEFGPGFLRVEILENRRHGVSRGDGMLLFTSENGLFSFSARVTSEVDMEDVYFVMRFKELGEARFLCRSLGRLEAGKPRVISILTRLHYEMPEQLHFYSGMGEIRTNLVPDTYSYDFGDFMIASN